MQRRKQTAVTAVFTFLSVAASLCFCGFRFGFIFIDREVFNGFCCLLWAIFIVNTVMLFAELRGAVTGSKLFNKKLFIINAVIAGFSAVVAVVFFIAGSQEALNYIYYSRVAAPYLLILYASLFFILVLPVCGKLFNRIVAAAVSLSMAVSVFVFFLPIGGFKIEELPAVFDTGDKYHIVFTTNRPSIAYAEIKTADGSVVLWDNTTGRKDSGTVHSIAVSHELLDNNEYTVGAVRAVEDIAYGGRLGKKNTVNVGKFTPCKNDGFEMACITDNHGVRVDWNSLAPDADVYLFLGDIANGLYCNASFIDNLIVPAAKISSGTKPVIFVRGNHDHRGNAVPALLDALDFDSYYYRLNIGKYNFTVFDSGEDKADDNYEYAGYNDYTSYRSEQYEWSKTLKAQKGYNVVLTHSSDIVYSDEEHSFPIGPVMKNLGADFLICGHSHIVKYIPPEESETGITTYICGGKDGSHNLNYTLMEFKDGRIKITSLSTNGETLNNSEVVLNESK